MIDAEENRPTLADAALAILDFSKGEIGRKSADADQWRKRAEAAETRLATVEAAFDAEWRHVIAFRMGQVCKHLIAANMLSRMEGLGFAVTQEVAHAVVFADDEAALAHSPIRLKRDGDVQ